ncbi:hypothetical protein CEXT_343601 [Caerostris extrusa]|uniref:Uncharacterized protein n=1 Tax=Caerostris extrusa TaxID=172846 RepID=A0AAV4YBN3_CAEEX|nr:hypothetical protein CEXT_343601 [Caerostris extrusa]
MDAGLVNAKAIEASAATLKKAEEAVTEAESKTEYYVITPKNLRPLKAVLKGLPVSYNVNEISTGLAELGLQIDEVRQLTNLKTRAPIPVWQLVYKNPNPKNNINNPRREFLAEQLKELEEVWQLYKTLRPGCSHDQSSPRQSPSLDEERPSEMDVEYVVSYPNVAVPFRCSFVPYP